METCEYEPVNSNVSHGAIKKTKWTPLLRQLLVSSTTWMSYFVLGMCTGAPTVIIPQLRKEAATAIISDESASWMSSINGYSSVPWFIALPLLTERYGRRLPFLCAHIFAIVGFIVIYYSSTVIQILIGEVIQGALPASTLTINMLVISEYSSPKYRGIFFTLKSATFTWGIWVSNALGTFLHWKTIPILGFISTIYCIVCAFFWPDSPYWLASKGYFKKCAASHRWLKGIDDDSEKELEVLIETHKDYLKNSRETKFRVQNIILSKDFCKPVSLCMVVLSLYHFNGKLVCAVYAIDILKKISNSEYQAYTGMLILDGVTVIGMYIGCALSKYIKRKTLLLTGSSIGILFLYIMSLYLYLIKLSVISENNYVSISFLSIFSLAMCCGPMLLASSIYGELIPLKMRSFSIFFIGIYIEILKSTMLKEAPLLFKYFELYGAFIFYGVMSTICALILYKYLPETKDKTLQDIQDSMTNDSSGKIKNSDRDNSEDSKI